MIREVSLAEYNKLINLQIENGVSYSEQFKGSRKTLIVKNRPLVSLLLSGSYLELDNLTNNQFGSFLGLFKNHIYRQLKKNDLFDLKISYNGLSRNKNKKLYEQAPILTTWYNVDLKSAYWQMGYILGYVSKNFYSKYMELDEYKSAKRFCYSFLARPNYRIYSNGQRINCDNTMDQQIFDNIRNKLYSIIQQGLDLCENECIEYNIDSITVSSRYLKTITDYFDSLSLVYSVNEMLKLNEHQYLLKNKVRKF